MLHMLEVINFKASSASIFAKSDRHSVTLEEVPVRARGGCHGYGMWVRQYQSY